MTQPAESLTERIHALIFNGITKASSTAQYEEDWIRLSERERIAQAVIAELRAGNIEFRLGPLAEIAEAVDTERGKSRDYEGPRGPHSDCQWGERCKVWPHLSHSFGAEAEAQTAAEPASCLGRDADSGRADGEQDGQAS